MAANMRLHMWKLTCSVHGMQEALDIVGTRRWELMAMSFGGADLQSGCVLARFVSLARCT